jgi:uncharacterized protein YeaO (DUF488 family)
MTALPAHPGNPVRGLAAPTPGVGPAFRVEDAAEQRSAATQRLAALGELTGGIAHDFRNLLSAIGSGLRLAEAFSGNPDKLLACLAEARVAIERGIALTSQLLSFASHHKLEPHTGNLNEILHTFEPVLRYGAGPDVRLVLQLAPALPDCLVDPAFFDAAVLNLVTNARDAMPGGGRIEVTTDSIMEAWGPDHRPEVSVRVRVRDHGKGMSPETLKKVFDPFFSTKGDRGTGIGLPQVRAFAEMVGGHMRIDSVPGAGTIVDILFPAVREQGDLVRDGTDRTASGSERAMIIKLSSDRVRLKRAYEPASPDDGTRILVDRLWPRGLRKDEAAIDEWAKELSPGAELRRWFDHDPERWEEFQRRYRMELNARSAELGGLRELAREGTITLLFAAHDPVHNNAVVLREVLLSEGQLERPLEHGPSPIGGLAVPGRMVKGAPNLIAWDKLNDEQRTALKRMNRGPSAKTDDDTIAGLLALGLVERRASGVGISRTGRELVIDALLRARLNR